MDIIEFAESIEYPLFPVQRVLLKLIYNVPLDNQSTFPVKRYRPWPGTPLKFRMQDMTEQGYADSLLIRGRSNALGNRPHQHISLVMGRRGGKDHLLTLIMAYEVFCQLDQPPLVAGTEHFTLVGPEADASRHSFEAFSTLVHRTEPLLVRLANDGRGFMCFQRRSDIEESGSWKGSQRQATASLVTRARSAQAKGLRGYNRRLAVLNEFDWFPLASADEVLRNCTSSIRTVGGRLLVTGTPSKHGSTQLREHHQKTFHDLVGLSLRVPTWEAHPDIPDDVFTREHERNYTQFLLEFGAEFLDEVTFLVPSGLSPVERGEYATAAIATGRSG